MRASHNPFPQVAPEGASGLNPSVIAGSVYCCWYKCQAGTDVATGLPLPEMVEQDEEYRYGWERGVGTTMPSLESADGTPWTTLARGLFANVQSALADGPGRDWEQLERPERLVWQACVRHLSNLMVHDVEDPPAVEFEDRMKAWYDERLARPPADNEEPAPPILSLPEINLRKAA